MPVRLTQTPEAGYSVQMELKFCRWLSLLIPITLILLSCGRDSDRPTEPAVSQDLHPEVPTVAHTGAVAPEILGISIQAQWVEPHSQVPYEAEADDQVHEDTNDRGIVISRTLFRDGKAIGWIGGTDQKTLTLFEKIRGAALDATQLDDPGTYSVTVTDSSGTKTSLVPVAVYRKSRPTSWVDPTREMPIEHTIYLKLPETLQEGLTYQIAFRNLNVTPETVTYVHSSKTNRSEAVHVSQVGFRPDDPAKTAFLSVWLGTGGSYRYPEPPNFEIVTDDGGAIAYQGQAVLVRVPDNSDASTPLENSTGTAVYRMDFGDLSKPGRYRVSVDGVGCSYPFQVGTDTWLDAFKTSMKGFYHIRSGIELGPPFTDYKRPMGYHAGDGFNVVGSTTTLMNSGDGLNCLETGKGRFGDLVEGKDEKLVNNAWGGYQDSGAWDRRIFHLRSSRLQMELMTLFPAYFASLNLNLPESGNSLPDILDEAIFNISCYKRMQEPDGGIRGGIAAEASPRAGEASWQESLTVLAFAPDIWSSYYYAGVAARAAFLLEQRMDVSAPAYRRTALLAMEWAEKRYQDWLKDSSIPRKPKTVRYERQLAALELYRLTREARWHMVFREDPVLKNPDIADPFMDANVGDAAFLYASIDETLTDPDLRKKAREAIIADAERALKFQNENAFGLTSSDPDRPLRDGFFSTPDVVQLCRAHYLTGEQRYLEAIVRATQYSLGANPSNLVYTTGLGLNPPQNPYHIDSRVSGQHVPSGITVYGQFPFAGQEGEEAASPIRHELAAACVPNLLHWPLAEAYFDVYDWPAMTDWTPQQTMDTVSYVWGYLAARP